METLLDSLRELWGIAKQPFDDWFAIDAAAVEAVESQLPGRENGPADAYRHLVWGAELTRRFGEPIARAILELHEIQGDTSALIGLEGQTPEAAAMDRHNHEPAIAIGRRARTFDDVVQDAQEFMDQSDRSGRGNNDSAMWLSPSKWSNHPKDKSGKELPRESWNWPETDWINGRVPLDPPYEYPYGSGKWRLFGIGDPGPILDPAGPVSAVNPLLRPVETWSEDDLRRVMASPAFLRPGDPSRAQAQAMVRAWFERSFGTGPIRLDATGRPVREEHATARSGASPVAVRAHTRQGGKVEVAAHCRTRPAA
jgi:hypothetical protein